MATSKYLSEYDKIVNTLQLYIDGSKQGDAFRHEIEAWHSLRTRYPAQTAAEQSQLQSPASAYLADHDAITQAMHNYIAGARSATPRRKRSIRGSR